MNSHSIARRLRCEYSVPRSARNAVLPLLLACVAAGPASAHDSTKYVRTKAYAVPYETTSEQSGYFSLVEGNDGKIYIGTAKYGSNAYLVAFDPQNESMTVVVDAQKEIGTTATGFAAQAKIHTRNNVGASGKIYFGTKQGYPQEGETRDAYLGGYPMVYDPRTGKTKVYPIPVEHQGIISVAPDESRGVAYISTCDDNRPVESTHFLILNLASGEYRDLMDCRHMYAFIVVDSRGRAYHPVLGGKIARYDPSSDKLVQLTQKIDGKPPAGDSLLVHPQSHPLNWDISPDKKTMYAVPMSGNDLYAYDLTTDGRELPGRQIGPLLEGDATTDCRAMCVSPNGTVWAGIAAKTPDRDAGLRIVSFSPKQDKLIDHGRVVITNPDYTTFTGDDGKTLKWHHGVQRLADGELAPRYVIMAICAARDGTVYFTTLYPFTLHAWKPAS
ncbi:MAG: SMP-30/gluconolactonase/LRE family protein [Planctomycetales bacterium]|nr:SMP-30/gluconolactonase/LRE family protein [Planctomycetales bacterium]